MGAGDPVPRPRGPAPAELRDRRSIPNALAPDDECWRMPSRICLKTPDHHLADGASVSVGRDAVPGVRDSPAARHLGQPGPRGRGPFPGYPHGVPKIFWGVCVKRRRGRRAPCAVRVRRHSGAERAAPSSPSFDRLRTNGESSAPKKLGGPHRLRTRMDPLVGPWVRKQEAPRCAPCGGRIFLCEPIWRPFTLRDGQSRGAIPVWNHRPDPRL